MLTVVTWALKRMRLFQKLQEICAQTTVVNKY